MSFQEFLQRYPADCEWPLPSTWTSEETRKLVETEPRLFTDFLSRIAAPSHGEGIIKFLSNESTPSIFEWNSELGWKGSWPDWKNRLAVFAYDWNGSLFGFDQIRKRQGELLISILEPDTGKLLQTPHSFAEFIANAVIDEADAALSASFYEEWRAKGGEVPGPGICVGCKIPAFLNGPETVENLALQPLGVYVSLCGQMFSQLRNLPPGTPISGFEIG